MTGDESAAIPLLAPVEDPMGSSPERLLADYERALRAVVTDAGEDRLAEATGLAPETVAAVGAGDVGDLSLRDAAAILARREGAPDAEAILVQIRDHLLLSMSSAMLDVDRIAADVEGDLEPREVQGKIEGRHPTTLEEYARLHHYIAAAT